MDVKNENVENNSGGSVLRDDLLGAYQTLRQAAGDMLGCVMVRLDEGLCAQLDAFVDAGAAENRRQAALYFLTVGLQARQDIYERIAQTELQVEQLRHQMRTLKTVESTE